MDGHDTPSGSAGNLLPLPGGPLLIGSGAMGSYLWHVGASPREPIEAMNLEESDCVLEVHRAYIDAGSDVLLANTFAAHRVALAEHGLEAEVIEVNREGVRLARTAAEGRVPVWASVGPLVLGFRGDDYSQADLEAIHEEQMSGLLEADALVLETFADPREAAAALAAAGRTGLPFIFQFGRFGRGATRQWRIDHIVGLAEEHGAAGIGANCQHPTDVVRTVRELLAATDLPVTAAPNAGSPSISRGVVDYELSPHAFACLGASLAHLGVAMIGGCCGTTPAHTHALRMHLGASKVAERASSGARVSSGGSGPRDLPSAGRQNRMRRLLGSGRPLVCVELRADRGKTLKQIVAEGADLTRAGADIVNVPDNPAARVGRSAAVVAAALQSSVGALALPHVVATHANVLHLHADLIGYWDLGLGALLALTGDPPSLGGFAGMAQRVTDVRSSVELLRLVGSLRDGELLSGDSVADPPDFCAGCAVRPGKQQMQWLDRKIAAGAEFAFSQPVFTLEQFERLHRDIGDRPIRTFTGVLPVTALRIAEHLGDGRIPGLEAPDEFLAAFLDLGSDAERREWGLERATDLAREVVRQKGLLYLIPPFGRRGAEDARQILEAVHGTERSAHPPDREPRRGSMPLHSRRRERGRPVATPR